MNQTRREWLKRGGVAALGAGFLSRFDRVAAAQTAAPTLAEIVAKQGDGPSAKLLLKPQPGEEGPPEPASYDRLPLEWNRKTVGRLKDRLAERDVEAFMVRDKNNIIYLTGYWHTQTERPTTPTPGTSTRASTGTWSPPGGSAAGRCTSTSITPTARSPTRGSCSRGRRSTCSSSS